VLGLILSPLPAKRLFVSLQRLVNSVLVDSKSVAKLARHKCGLPYQFARDTAPPEQLAPRAHPGRAPAPSTAFRSLRHPEHSPFRLASHTCSWSFGVEVAVEEERRLAYRSRHPALAWEEVEEERVTREVVPVTPGAQYTITVGAGGPQEFGSTAVDPNTGSAGQSGGAGGATQILDSTSNVLATAGEASGGGGAFVSFDFATTNVGLGGSGSRHIGPKCGRSQWRRRDRRHPGIPCERSMSSRFERGRWRGRAWHPRVDLQFERNRNRRGGRRWHTGLARRKRANRRTRLRAHHLVTHVSRGTSQFRPPVWRAWVCAYRKSHSAVFTNVALLLCAQNLPQYQFARDRPCVLPSLPFSSPACILSQKTGPLPIVLRTGDCDRLE